jgi:subtilisin family serine protease
MPTAPTVAARARPSRPTLETGALRPPIYAETRPKLEEQDQADDSFVNVFIELFRERPGVPEDLQRREVDSLVNAMQEAAAAARQHGVRGVVLPRRNFIAATVPVSKLREIGRQPAVAFVQPADPLKLDAPPRARAAAAVEKAVGRPEVHGRGENVLIGIIDVGGFDFAHPDFLDDADRTRFVAIWDQGGDFRDPPPAFGYGAEFRKDALDAAIVAAGTSGLPPAHFIERQSQLEPGSHGTHVASIAAGRSGVCPKALIAAVLIDVPTPQDEVERRRATFSDTSRIIHAVEYLLDIAAERNLPISINISLGTNGGAHDGSSGVSRWLDVYLGAPGRAICAAAGNAGQESAQEEGDLGWTMGRIHAAGRVASRGLEVELEWTVVGDGIEDLSENELEIWYGSQDRFSVALQPPRSGGWIHVKPGEYVENRRLPSGTIVSVYNELYHPTNGANYLALYLSPQLDPADLRGIEAGVWKVRIIGDEVRDGRFDAWIERDDPVEVEHIGNRRLFRFPSFFSARSTTDSHSISSLACGYRLIAVGNLDDVRQRIYPSSSQGPTRDGRYKPEIAAPGTNVVAASGFTGPEERWLKMTGTSMASPYVAGVVGLMLGANRQLTAAQCGGILQRTARPLPGSSYEWGNDVGFGRIDPEGAIEEARITNDRREVGK